MGLFLKKLTKIPITVKLKSHPKMHHVLSFSIFFDNLRHPGIEIWNHGLFAVIDPGYQVKAE